MGMILQLPAPRLQDAKKTGQIAANVFGIGRKFFKRIGRGFKQGRVAAALVAANGVGPCYVIDIADKMP